MKFVLCFIICVYSTFARSEKLYFFSGFKSSQNNQFQLTLEGYAFEGPVGDQRLIIKEANIILTDTLTNTPVIPDISNKGDLAIPYPDKIIFYNKYFIPIGSYLKNDSLITFHFGWGDLPYWGVFSTDGNTYYTIAYKKGEGAIILVIGLDGNEINRHPVLEYNPTSQGVYKNMLITLSMKSQTNKGNNRIIGIDNNGTKVLDYEINSYFQNYNSFAIDRNEGFLMFHIHSDDSITTIDILSGQPKAKLSLREAEKYLFGNDLETTKFILSVFERKNHAIMSTEHLNKLINLYNSFVIYPKKSNSVINSIINNSLYIINLSEFRKKYPDFRYH